MTRYRLHCVGASGNSFKVALFLNCAGLDWEPLGVDFAGGETRDPIWRATTNEMGEIPVLEVDGRRLSQSGAILEWLAETHGKFGPSSAAERFETARWLLFDNHRFTGNFAAHRVLQSMMPNPPHPDVLAYVRARTQSALSIVEKHLGNHSFMLGGRPTIVDFSLAGYLYYPTEETGFDLRTAFPAIDAWCGRIAALPGWKPPYEMMPVGHSLPVVCSATAVLHV
ncbi:glutathione S-transferase C-terminal domain-containing protein [Bradyrhizobium liaoningense]|uniref:glutathione S-transferase family protein n=1 Tax=Bradyrhizobium liaoningense TaxID=43992 RepID=UPI001BA87D79|nr:glutathione S-transferase [Bradyrhizobium liaoningense]MBR0839611.1 glutathione S-transferase C-terminal domain-containing protein [Bradyrhizobium liaoningense]MBR0855849.1 glutathione S-transferase C-terminal domain-containing protein [Bradyrhizobium liaoningense]